jgi:hypothetical protein
LYCFIYSLYLLVSYRYYLGAAANLRNLQDSQEEDFEQLLVGNQLFLDHVDPICFLPLVTHLHALIWITYNLYTYRNGIMFSRFA